MADFDTVEDTLFVPMLGRIYASEHYPHILNDTKALELKAKLPASIKGQDTQTEYTFMASAVRSTNMDRYIKDFMSRHADGIIVQLGAGLETTYYRDDNGINEWYEIDLPAVIEYRQELLGETERDHFIAGDAFGEEWIKEIRLAHPDAPLLVTASGLFYYFEEEKVVDLFKRLKAYGDVEILFDTVNSSGMKRMAKYMQQVGHADAAMYFYVDSGEALANEIGAELLMEEPYYAHTVRKGMKFMTRISMALSDKFKMVKMIHIKLG